MTNINNTLSKLKNDKTLTIGYFGGSITEGAGASDPNSISWRALTTQWFRDTFDECCIHDVNAAIGGTGSDLGAYRCGRDLLAYKPDLVFIEFAVNDYGSPEDRICRSMEGIVRQIKKQNPEADIVFVYTVSKKIAEDTYDIGEVPHTVVLHQQIANHYEIHSVNVGEILWKNIQTGIGTWEEFMTDGVHPSDAGHKIYGTVVQEFLKSYITKKGRKNTKMPEPLTNKPIEDGQLIDAWEISTRDWKKEEISLAQRYPRRIASNKPGAELLYTFYGSSIGLYWLIAPDSGDIEWSIDDFVPERVSSWDKYALKFTRAHYIILRDDLDRREHKLRIKILPDKAPESVGNFVRIGALLLGES